MNNNEEIDSDLEFRKNLVKQRFGHRLNPTEWQEVEEAVTGIHKMVESLRAAEINNSDDVCKGVKSPFDLC